MTSERGKSTVFIRSVVKSLRQAVQDCLARCNWEQWLSPNAVVVIKPNLCTADPDKVAASNTDVAVMEALCEALLTRTSRIFIGEAGHLRQNPWQAFTASGYDEMSQRLGVELVNFTEEPVILVKCDPVKALPMPRRLLEADVYINVPVLKTHALTHFTGALKNQWGCIPDCHDRLRYHGSIDVMLSSLQHLLRPKFVLMDAIVGMEGRGPVNGQPRRLDTILASCDAVAIDATAMRLVGLNPARAKHLMIAGKQELGRVLLEDIEVDGDWDKLRVKFEPPPRDFANRAMLLASQYPWFVKHVLANDRVYYPVKGMVTLLRKVGIVAR